MVPTKKKALSLKKENVNISAVSNELVSNKEETHFAVAATGASDGGIEENLKQSLHLNTSILNTLSDIFISVDNSWNFTFANDPAKKFIELGV